MGGREALWRFAYSAMRAGVTTATDLANELLEETVASQVAETANERFPLRIVPAFFAATRALARADHSLGRRRHSHGAAVSDRSGCPGPAGDRRKRRRFHGCRPGLDGVGAERRG